MGKKLLQTQKELLALSKFHADGIDHYIFSKADSLQFLSQALAPEIFFANGYVAINLNY